MEKNVTSEQQLDKIADSLQDIVGQSLVDILTAIALLENSLDEQTEGSLPENLPTIHALIDNLIAEFQTLDQQLKVNSSHQQIYRNYQDLAQKAHLKNLVANWVTKNSLDKSAWTIGVGELNPTLVIILLYPWLTLYISARRQREAVKR